MGPPDQDTTILCLTGGLLLIGSAIIHLQLWSIGYRHIPTIGALFLLQGLTGIVLAVAVAVTRRAPVALAGALFAVGTIGGLVVSVEVGLFGFRDRFSAPYAASSLVVESAAFFALVAATLTGIHHAAKVPHDPAAELATK